MDLVKILKQAVGKGNTKLPSFEKISTEFPPCDTEFYLQLGYNILEAMLQENITDRKLLVGNVVDIGCGAASFGGIINKVYGGKVQNVDDNSTHQLSPYRRIYIKPDDFIESDNLKFLKEQPPNSVDLITCLDFEPFDFDYYKQLLDESKSALKEGGKFITTIRSKGWRRMISHQLPEIRILELPIRYPGSNSPEPPYSANQTFIFQK